MSRTERLSESLEDYLEAIFHLVSSNQKARVRDIARRLKVSMSSVTGALRLLSEKKLINYAPYEMISLTPKGNKLAKDVVRRHEALRDFFVKVLAVDEDLADEMACKMEHIVPHKVINRIIKFVDFVETCPHANADWLEGFGYHCQEPLQTSECNHCDLKPPIETITKSKTKKKVDRGK